jgi:hypothetical protein
MLSQRMIYSRRVVYTDLLYFARPRRFHLFDSIVGCQFGPTFGNPSTFRRPNPRSIVSPRNSHGESSSKLEQFACLGNHKKSHCPYRVHCNQDSNGAPSMII